MARRLGGAGASNSGGKDEVPEEAARCIEGETPWYETLGLQWGQAGDRGGDAAVETVLAFNIANGLIDAASGTLLAPAFVALKGLLGAAQGAAAAREGVVELVWYCVRISRTLLGALGKGGQEAPRAVFSTLEEFEGAAEAVKTFAQAYGGRGWFRRLALGPSDRATAAGLKQKLKDLLDSLQAGLAVQTADDLARINRMIVDRDPPRRGALAEIPREADALPTTYVRRAALAEGVVRSLVDPRRRSALAAHYLIGMGGGGKTLLASSVARDDRVRAEFKDGVFWILVGQRGGENATLLLLLLERLAVDLASAPTDSPHRCPLRFNDYEEAARHLSATRTRKRLRCLVVLDDVWEACVVNAFAGTGFHILVTTRQRAVVLPAHAGCCTEVGDLSEAEALEVLSKASGALGPLPATEALEVAHECGMLPLAVCIAGSLVKDRPLDPASWRNTHLELREKHVKFREIENGKLFSTIDTSFSNLGRAHRKQFQQLVVMASGFVATHAMLANLWQTDSSDVPVEAGVLMDHCLLQEAHCFLQEALHGGGGGYRLHDLVLEYLVLVMPMRRDGRRLLEEACARQASFLSTPEVLRTYSAGGEATTSSGGLYSLVAAWNSLSELLSDGSAALSVARCYRDNLGLEEEDGDNELRQEAGELLMLLGEYAGAREMNEEALAMARQTGAGPEEVGMALNNLGLVLQKQGEYEKADAIFLEAIEAARDASGVDQLSLANWLLNRAGALASQEKFKEADLLYLQAIKIQETVLGCDQPAHAIALNNRAQSLISQGKVDEAEPLCRRAVEMGEAALGPDHPRVAIRIHNLARVFQAQGNLEEADRCFLRAIAIGEKMIGANHPELATWLANRATLLHCQGKWAEADEFFSRAIDIGGKTLGRNHPSIAAWLSHHARLLKCQERCDEADLLLVRAIDIVKLSSPDSLQLATLLNNRGRLLLTQEKLEAADELFLQSIAIEERILGPDHPDHARTLNNRVVLLQCQKKYDQAEALCRLTIEIEEATQTPCRPRIAMRLAKLANIFTSQEKLEEARSVLQRAVPMLADAFGEQDKRTKGASDALDALRRR